MSFISSWKGWYKHMGLFPSYIENSAAASTAKKPSVPREYGIDFATGQLTGQIVEGREAIKVWVWLALQTPRYRHYVYSWDYGNEYGDLIGQGYTEEYTEAEVRRMTEDCLLVNEDIREISGFSVKMERDTLSVTFTANTIYGDIEIKDLEVA